MQSVRCRICLEDVESSAFSMLPRNGWYNEMKMDASDIKPQEGRSTFAMSVHRNSYWGEGCRQWCGARLITSGVHASIHIFPNEAMYFIPKRGYWE